MDDRSLPSGISIPQWMKNKRLDFQEAAFSPPDNDDNFLYIKYPQDLSKKLKSPLLGRRTSNSNITIKPENGIENHTESCKQYILKPEFHPSVTLTDHQTAYKIKSNGIDDNSKGDGSACGSSVIRFAHQMVSGKYTNPDPMAPLNEALLKRRRGSKSLPASPQTSPKSRRHKYFTGAFVEDENNTNGSWLLHGLLSKREASQQSVNNLSDESADVSLTKAVSDLRLNDKKEGPKKEFKAAAAPSEFREMNFWSPTSM